MGTEPVDYCREVEAYLCRKNDGHLIRVVGPSFALVSQWEADGVPLKVAFSGIDRCFERYYRRGPRRRPVRIDFCDADVRDVFDEWRRALGLPLGGAAAADGASDAADPRAPAGSLPAHLERASLRLTSARAAGTLGPDADPILDRLAGELDAARRSAGGLRGAARRAAIDRLAALDDELLTAARAAVDSPLRHALEREADEELAAFRERMPEPAFARARAAAVDRLIRERLKLPTLSFG